MKKEDLLYSVISSNILDDYRSHDQELNELIILAQQSLNNWKQSGKIFIGDRLIPALETKRIFSDRLEILHFTQRTDGYDEDGELEACIRKIIQYCSSNPNGFTKVILFNCTKYSYDVHLGVNNQNVEIICTIKGKPIPQDALE